jgi:hypothetical protein
MKRTYSSRYTATKNINDLPYEILERIFQNLNEISVIKTGQVCKKWNDVIESNLIWKPLVEARVKNDFNWKEMAERRGWIEDLFNQQKQKPDSYYRSLFLQAKRDIPRINSNCFSESGSTEEFLEVPLDNEERLTRIEVNDKNIFVGTNRGNIKIINRKEPIQCSTLSTGHTGFITALQMNDKVLVCASLDETNNEIIRVWSIESIPSESGQFLPIQEIQFTGRLWRLCLSQNSLIGVCDDPPLENARDITLWQMEESLHFSEIKQWNAFDDDEYDDIEDVYERYCHKLTLDENFIICATYDDNRNSWKIKVWRKSTTLLHLNLSVNSSIDRMTSDKNNLVVKTLSNRLEHIILFNLETGDQIWKLPWDRNSTYPRVSDLIKEKINMWKIDSFWVDDPRDEEEVRIDRHYSQFQLISVDDTWQCVKIRDLAKSIIEEEVEPK